MLTDPNQRATTVKKPGHYRNQCCLLKRQREQSENTQNNPGNRNSGANISIPNNNTNKNNNNYKNSDKPGRKPKPVYPPCETCGKTNHSTETCYYGGNAANRPPPQHIRLERQNQVQEGANQNDSNETSHAAAQNLNRKCHVFTPELRRRDGRLQNFDQSLELSGSNPRRLIYLIYIIDLLVTFNGKMM